VGGIWEALIKTQIGQSMKYKRQSPFNKAKQENIKKLELHLKKVDELRTNNRQNESLQR